MNTVKAKLKVVLQADNTVVAESEDTNLWQRVLVAINKGTGTTDSILLDDEKSAAPRSRQSGDLADIHHGDADEDFIRFSKTIGTDVANIVGACSPSKTSPYLTLDMHYWNTMKDQTPARGLGAISPLALAATLLALWMQSAKLGHATQAEAQKVLGTINLRDANPTRSVQGADWLQGRTAGVIVINPARSKRAAAIARAFCSQDWKSDLTWKGSNE